MSRALSAAIAIALLAMSCKRATPGPVGHDLFAATCSRCHGPDGAGGLPLWDGGPAPRNFHEHAFHAAHSDEQLRETIVKGKGAGMPAFGATYDDTQLTALVAQIRSFDTERAQ